MSKLTLKNATVYQFMKLNAKDDETSVKAFYRNNEEEIRRRFGINNYAGFNHHIRKVLDYEAQTGKRLEIHTINNEGIVNDEAR